MNNYIKDILNQYKSLEQATKGYLDMGYMEKIHMIAEGKYEKILFTGMGSSHYACYGPSIHLNSNGFTSLVKSTSQLIHYEMNLIDNKTLVVIVSQSGESAEITKLINIIPETAGVIGLTNFAKSTLGKSADYTFCLNVKREESISTRTYLATIVLLNIFAKKMTGVDSKIIYNQIENSMVSMQKNLNMYKNFLNIIQDFVDVSRHTVIIGRGVSYSTVYSGALFISEVAKIPCLGMDSGEFRHGPIEIVDEDLSAIIIAPKDNSFKLNSDLAMDIAKKGGKVLFITDGISDLSYNNIYKIELEPSERYFSPLNEIIPIQLTANYLAECRNLEPGNFRWSTKIQKKE